MNRANLSGFVASDPTARYTAAGNLVIHFPLAVRKGSKRNAEGNYDTNFFDVEAWGKAAEIASDRMIKGDFILIDGRLESDAYEQDGKRKRRTKIIAEYIEYIPREPKAAPGSASTPEAGVEAKPSDAPPSLGMAAAANPSGNQPGQSQALADLPDEEIPF